MKGVVLVDGCALCLENSKAVQHCNFTRSPGTLFVPSLNVCWVMPSSIKEVFFTWRLARLDFVESRVWSALPPCIWWFVWMERNSSVFNDVVFSLD